MANFKSEPNFTQNTRKEQNSGEFIIFRVSKDILGNSEVSL